MTTLSTHVTRVLVTLRGALLSLLLTATLLPAPDALCADDAHEHHGHHTHAPAPQATRPSPYVLASTVYAADVSGPLLDWLYGVRCPDCGQRVGGILGGDRCGCDEPGGSGLA